MLTVAAGLTNVPDAAALCEIARKAGVPIDRTAARRSAPRCRSSAADREVESASNSQLEQHAVSYDERQLPAR